MPKSTSLKLAAKLIADYRTIGNYKKVAKLNGVCDQTVRRIVMREFDLNEIADKEMEEAKKDIVAHMYTKTDQVCGLMDKYLEELIRPERIEKASISQLAVVLGILIDKFTMIDKSGSADTNGIKLTVEGLSTEEAKEWLN